MTDAPTPDLVVQAVARCHRCDRPLCEETCSGVPGYLSVEHREAWCHKGGLYSDGRSQCALRKVDWRARTLVSEAALAETQQDAAEARPIIEALKRAREPRTAAECRYCGAFSSAQSCERCSHSPLMLHFVAAEIARDAAEAALAASRAEGERLMGLLRQLFYARIATGEKIEDLLAASGQDEVWHAVYAALAGQEAGQ